MLSINQIIEANEKSGNSPFFLIDSHQEGFSNLAFVANSIKRTNLMTPDEVSRAFIQQLTNLACHINLMEISLELSSIYEGVGKFNKSLGFAKLINSALGGFESLNQKALNSVLNHSGLPNIDAGIRETMTLLPKIEDHLDEMSRIIEVQIEGTNELVSQYRSDCTERKILCNTVINNVLGGKSSSVDDTKMLNDVMSISEFSEQLGSYATLYQNFYAGLIEQIALAKASLKEISVNFASTVDLIDGYATSPVKTLVLQPTDSFEADISTLVRKSMNGESPLLLLASVLEKHIVFISDANAELIEVANTIDQQVNYFGEEIRTVIQPHVSCDLVKVTAESMLNTQRKYEYNPEN